MTFFKQRLSFSVQFDVKFDFGTFNSYKTLEPLLVIDLNDEVFAQKNLAFVSIKSGKIFLEKKIF